MADDQPETDWNALRRRVQAKTVGARRALADTEREEGGTADNGEGN